MTRFAVANDAFEWPATCASHVKVGWFDARTAIGAGQARAAGVQALPSSTRAPRCGPGALAEAQAIGVSVRAPTHIHPRCRCPVKISQG